MAGYDGVPSPQKVTGLPDHAAHCAAPEEYRCYQVSLRGIMHATTSAAGQAIGKQFKNTTSPMSSTRLTTVIVVGRTYKAARLTSSPI